MFLSIQSGNCSAHCELWQLARHLWGCRKRWFFFFFSSFIYAHLYFSVPCSLTVYKYSSKSGSLCPATSQLYLTLWKTTCQHFGSFHPLYCYTSLIWLMAMETQLCTTVCLTPTLALSRNCLMQVQLCSQGNWVYSNHTGFCIFCPSSLWEFILFLYSLHLKHNQKRL